LAVGAEHFYAKSQSDQKSPIGSDGIMYRRDTKRQNRHMITSHKDLIVWQKSVVLAGKVYAATRQLPRDERFGISLQLRRAAISIPSNIAEGSARRTRAEFVQYLHIARGSLSEVETQMMVVRDQGLLTASTCLLEDIAEIGRMLNALIRKLTIDRQAAHAKACAPHQSPTANR
jgi:four helix bundle protein